MNSESHFWKEEIKTNLNNFEHWSKVYLRCLTHGNDFDESLFHMEKAIYQNSLIVRLLIDNHKITDRLSSYNIPSIEYAAKLSKPISLADFKTSNDLDRYYNLDSGKDSSIGVYKFSSEIIHANGLAFVVNSKSDIVEQYS